MRISRRNWFQKTVGMGLCGAVSTFGGNAAKAETKQGEETETLFELYPVGKVEKEGESVRLRIFDKYTDALKGLDGFSHVFVLYWFDKNDTPAKRGILQVHPRGNKNNPLTGVFACRSPVRPNLIALTLCRIISVEGDVVHIDKIDAFDETPVLDLKPYIPGIDEEKENVRLPDWL